MEIKTRNPAKRIFLILMVLAVIGSLTVLPASADDYYLTDDELGGHYMPETYEVDEVVLTIDNQTKTLESPQDIFVDSNDNVYIADTGNNRVIMLDSEMKYVKTYPNNKSGKKGRLSSPNGVFVDDDGDLYIADTDNGRIVHLAKDGTFVEEFTQPTEETYDTDNPFNPTKVYVDEFGTIYVLNGKDHHGIITLNSRGEFLAYVGTISTKYSLTQQLVRMFGSETQIDLTGQESPPYYSNISINGDGTIYAVSSLEESEQIKRLTPSGDNVYTETEFGEENKKTEYNNIASFIDLAVNDDGIVFAADVASSKIYIYDQQGNNVAVFGGEGQAERTFQLISSMAIMSNNEILVLDSSLNTIQKLKPTDFMTNLFTATTLYNNGKYEESIEPWNTVLSMASTYKFAQVGIAKSLLREGNNTEALALYKSALDVSGYSEAFEEVRTDFFRAHFYILVLVIIVGVVAVIFVAGKLKKYANVIADRKAPENDSMGVKFFGETVVCVLFHPMDAFYRIKYNRKALKVWPILAMLALLVVEKILFRLLIHFPLTDNIIRVDYLKDLTVFFLPLVSWIVVCYAITSIMDGKQTFIETASSTLYSFIPFMILYIPITALSNVMCTSESGLYNGLQLVLLIWCLLLIFCNFKILNEYSFGKAVGTIIIIIFAMLCLWIICFLFYIIVSQLFTFIGDVYTEFVYMTK